LSIELRQCPVCTSTHTTFVQRGFAGQTDERDQFFRCDECGRVTFEIVSRTPREIRVGRLEAGRQVKLAGEEYTVSRVLKVGLNESLVYVKPVPSAAPLRGGRAAPGTERSPQRSAPTRPRPGHR
jgi:hypothetical protein